MARRADQAKLLPLCCCAAASAEFLLSSHIALFLVLVLSAVEARYHLRLPAFSQLAVPLKPETGDW